MEQLIQQIASGLANGAIYACLALALVMIFVSTDHINFAQGEMAMFSAYVCWQLHAVGSELLDRAAAGGARSRSSLGVGIERMILRPLHNAPVLSVVVVFIGLLAIFHSLAGGIWSHTIKDFPSPFPKVTFAGSGYHRPAPDRHDRGDARAAAGAVRLLPLHAAGACHARGGAEPGLGAPGRRSRRLDAGARLGAWRRRSARSPAAMVAPVVYLEPNMMASILLYGFAGALVGGISSPGGAVAGGFIVGVLENLIAYFGNLLEKTSGLYLDRQRREADAWR